MMYARGLDDVGVGLLVVEEGWAGPGGGAGLGMGSDARAVRMNSLAGVPDAGLEVAGGLEWALVVAGVLLCCCDTLELTSGMK